MVLKILIDLAQNFGITSGFAVGFFVLFNVFTEWNTVPADQQTVTLFKRGSGVLPSPSTETNDEERQLSDEQDVVHVSHSPESHSNSSEKKPYHYVRGVHLAACLLYSTHWRWTGQEVVGRYFGFCFSGKAYGVDGRVWCRERSAAFLLKENFNED